MLSSQIVYEQYIWSHSEETAGFMNNRIYWLQHPWFFWIASDKCIDCRRAVHSTNHMIAITTSVSWVNTQHSQGHKTYQKVSLLGSAKKTNPLICPCNFLSDYHAPRKVWNWGTFYALLVTVLQSAVKRSCSQTLCSLLSHCTEYFSIRRCTWFVLNIPGYQVEGWDPVASTSLHVPP